MNSSESIQLKSFKFYPFLCVSFAFLSWLDGFGKLYFSMQVNVMGFSEALLKINHRNLDEKQNGKQL